MEHTHSSRGSSRGARTSSVDEHLLRHIVFRGDDAIPSSERCGESRPQAQLDPALNRFYDRLFAHGRIDGSRFRPTVLERRASACMRAMRASGPTHAQRILEKDGDAADRALQAVIIGVSSFFRDAAVFDALGQLLQARANATPPRILSVGCSDGQEVYSVAMLLAELGLTPDVLVGLDCRARAVRAARMGIYDVESVKPLSDPLARRWLEPLATKNGHRVRVDARLRARCQWLVGDAFTSLPPGTFDVVMCRNLAIYLSKSAASELWQRLVDHLAPGGLLVVGKAERPVCSAPLERVAPCIYRTVEHRS